MSMSNPLVKNPLRTRADLQQAVVDLFDPLKGHFSPGRARVTLGSTGSYSSARSGELEGFARPLWGLIPLAIGGGNFEHWELYRAGLAHGTDPGHQEYWGELGDLHQAFVEMAAIGYALATIPELVWQPLDDHQHGNITRWLNQINQFELHDCNWIFFRVMVNLGLKKVGATYSESALEAALLRLEDFYLGDGWYCDGPGRPRDYYISFAMHFYGLVYSTLTGDSDPERAQRFTDRARLFAQDFVHWFAEDGAAIPFGRSMTYRFAQSSFWSALALAGVEALPWGVIKGLVLRNLRWWARQDIFDSADLLTIGYTYPSLLITEDYISPGSPYWAMKAFQCLAVPETHPFWQADEAPLPTLEPIRSMEHAGMILCRETTGKHIFALVSGQEAVWCRYGEAKYGKFAYSNLFGFSVPGAQPDLDRGAYDSTLAVSDDGRYYRSRETCLDASLADGILYSRWQPWPDVDVETWLLPLLPWHVRLHRVRTARPLHTAEGGFALPSTENRQGTSEWDIRDTHGVSHISNFHGISGLRDLLGTRRGQSQMADPNTNLLYPRTRIPTLLDVLPPGEHFLACAVLGLAPSEDAAHVWDNPPELRHSDGTLVVYQLGQEIRRFSMSAGVNPNPPPTSNS